MTSLSRLQKHWEGFARIDPLWAICQDRAKYGRQWTEEEFFATGKREIEKVMQYLQALGFSPCRSAAVLDFGCGVGRLTSALSGYFEECWGVDIAPTMIQLAEKFHHANPRCHFVLNQAEDLKCLADGQFVFVYTSIVLQHMERRLAEKYLMEFVRVLKPGGVLLFQICDRDRSSSVQKLRHVVGFRSRWSRILRPRSTDAFRCEMHCLAETEIRRLLSGQKVRIADVQLTNSTEGSFNGDLQFLKEEPETGYVSKQYCIVKAA